MPITRRDLIVSTSCAGLAALVPVRPARAGFEPERSLPRFPRQDEASVKEVVNASHGNFDRVKELVNKRPALAKATWDWGFGDWETALGAASHVGRPDIAEFLIAHGARIDIFAAAMLGHLDAVKGFVAASPGIQRTLGPHGLPLLVHAKAGKERAAAVVEYLEKLGDAGVLQKSAPISDEDLAACVGSFAAATGEKFEVQEKLGQIQIAPAGGTPRALFHIGDAVFHPTGAAAVRVRFELREGKAASVEIVDGDIKLIAPRVG